MVKSEKKEEEKKPTLVKGMYKDLEIGFNKLNKEMKSNFKIFRDIKTPTQMMFETIAISFLFYIFYVYLVPLVTNIFVYMGSLLLDVTLTIMPQLPPTLAQIFNTFFGLTIWLNEIFIITYFVVLYYRLQAIIKKERVEILRKVKEEEIGMG